MGTEGEHMASGDPLALLDAAIDALNARLDDTVTDGELNQVVIGLAECRHRVEATLATWAARWDARLVWASDGSRSPAARLARDANEAPATAARTLRRGRCLAAMPHTADAWSAGEISGDHVDLLATAHGSGRDQLFARDEELLVDQCVELRHRQAQQMLRYWCQRADAELGRDGPEPVATELQVRTTFDGAVVGNFTLDALGGGIVQESLRRIERDLYRQDKANGIARTKAERMAAALVEQAVRAHTAPEGGQRPDPLLMVLAGEAQVEQLCELATGTVIHPGQLVPILDHLMVETFIFHGADQVLATSPTRSFRGRLRRASKPVTVTVSTRRDVTCPSPGATSTTPSPTPKAGSPKKATAGCSARNTTATPTSTTANPPSTSTTPDNAADNNASNATTNDDMPPRPPRTTTPPPPRDPTRASCRSTPTDSKRRPWCEPG